MCSVYPEILPQSLCKLPGLLKGNVSEAASIFLAAKCDEAGALACEKAGRLLDAEMVSGNTPYSFEERWAILENAHKLDDWSVAEGKDSLNNLEVWMKVDFVISLATSFAQRERDNFIRFMNEAAHCARYLAEIYRKRLEAEKSENDEQEAENAE